MKAPYLGSDEAHLAPTPASCWVLDDMPALRHAKLTLTALRSCCG